MSVRLRVRVPQLPGALCAQADPEAWFPEKGERPSAAVRQICAQCPCQAACRQWAIRRHEIWGVWGGTTSQQRMREWRTAA